MDIHERCVQIIKTCERAGEPVNDMQRAVLIGAIAFHLNDIARVERKAGFEEALEVTAEYIDRWDERTDVAGWVKEAILKRSGEIG
jgi:hypothetical protein